MAKIYWLTGQPEAGKTVLGKKLVEFLSTEKRNWRSKVFHIDGDDLRELTINKDYFKEDIPQNLHIVQIMAEYIYKNGCDTVISFTPLNREIIENFKNRIGDDIEEFYIHNSKKKVVEEYNPPLSNFFEVDTVKDNPIQSFTKIVHYLREKSL
jgi:adenylylsulfate kinase-like enzyme